MRLSEDEKKKNVSSRYERKNVTFDKLTKEILQIEMKWEISLWNINATSPTGQRCVRAVSQRVLIM